MKSIVALLGLYVFSADCTPLRDAAQLEHDTALTRQEKQSMSMLSIHADLHATPPEGTETVIHIKEKNGGYVKGSPLYTKQERLEDKASHKKDVQKAPAPAEVYNPVQQAVTDNKAVPQAGTDPIIEAQENVYKKLLMETIINVSVYAILVLACAYAYSKRRAPPLGSRVLVGGDARTKFPAWTACGFAHSFFDFTRLKEDWPICLTAWCCPIIQWADTASRSAQPFMSFWKAIAFSLTMVILAPFTLGLTGLVLMIALYMRRRRLRESYHHTRDEGRSMVEDLCLVFCCSSFMCCQLVQEAREVEYTTPKVMVVGSSTKV